MRIGKTREFAASAIEQICDIAPVPHCYEKTVRTNDGKRLYVWLLDAGEEHSVDVTRRSRRMRGRMNAPSSVLLFLA